MSEVVRQSVEETLNGLWDAEADALCQARRYERNSQRASTRAGHYERSFQTKAGTVQLNTGKWRIQLPELVAQKLIVERLNAAKEVTNSLELINITKLNSLRALKQSLLTAAFFGELTADFNSDALEL